MHRNSGALHPFAEWVVARRLWVIVTLLGITIFLASRIGTLQYV